MCNKGFSVKKKKAAQETFLIIIINGENGGVA